MNWSASLVILLMTVLVAGCIPRKDRGKLLSKMEMHAVRMQNEHTGLPDLLMRVPSGFVVEWTKEARYEKYFIYNPKDTGEVQKGMAVIDLTPYPAQSIPDTGKKVERSLGELAGQDVTWKEYLVEEPGSPPLHQREMTITSIFKEAEKFKENEQKKNVLHAFVVGTDRDLVEILAASVETITVLPRKPNL